MTFGTHRLRAVIRNSVLVGGALLGAPAISGALHVGSFLYFWFDPQVIYNDGVDATTLRITTDGKDIALVHLESADHRWLQMYDDGTHGDRTASDGTFSLNGITSDTLGLTNRVLAYGGTHVPYGFATKITKKDGKVSIVNEVGIGIVDKNQKFDVQKLAAGIYATESAVCLVDPPGKTLGARIPLGKVHCGDTAFLAFKKLYSVFPDAFDFVIVMPAGQIFDPARDYAENVPYEVNAKNEIEHIERSIFDNCSKFFSAGRLRGMIYHSFGDGQILDHEIGHGWVLGFGESLGISDGAHWLANTDVGGQMSGHVVAGGRNGYLVPNGDGTWKVVEPRWDRETYSMLDLYLMGLLPPGPVPAVHKLIEPDYSNPDRVTAKSVETYTIQQLMAAVGGPRKPASKDSPRSFNIALVVVKNKAFTKAEYAWFSLVANVFASRGHGDFSLTTFYDATRRKATLDARLPEPLR